MSPILEFSLAIVFFLWVIPLFWAVSKSIRALPGAVGSLIRFFQSFPSRLLADKESRLHLQTELDLERDYQSLQSDLIALRGVVSRAIDSQAELESELRDLSAETETFEEKVSSEAATQRDKDLAVAKREKLLQLVRILEAHKRRLHTLRQGLTDKEFEVQKAYVRKQVWIAQSKAERASKKAEKSLDHADGMAVKTLELMEAKVRQRERQAYGSSHLSDQNINFPVFSESVSRLPLDKLSRGELEELLSTIEHALGDLWAVVERTEVNDELLFSQLKAAEADAQSWKQQAEEAEREEKEFFAKQAKVYQFDCEVSARKYQQMLDSSTKETSELKVMEKKLARKKEEIYLRIAELDSESSDRKSVE